MMPYASPDDFFASIDAQYDHLSKRLQSIARDLPQFREQIAVMNINQLAERLETSTAAIVRFSQAMGFSGFSEMKALFQKNLTGLMNDNYQNRIDELSNQQSNENLLIQSLVQKHLHSLEDLFQERLLEEIQQASQCMLQAKALFVMAAGRSFAAAAYFTYLLQHCETPIHWLNGLCFNLDGKLHALSDGDVVLVISYAPYAEVSCQTARMAQERGAKVIAITDSHLGDIAQSSDYLIQVRESSHYGFRSLVSTMSVIQALFLTYASHIPTSKPKH